MQVIKDEVEPSEESEEEEEESVEEGVTYITRVEDLLIEPNDFIMQNKGNVRDFYRIGKVIGTGTFAQVRLSINKSTGAQRALKVIAKNRFNPDQDAILENEVQIHKSLDHPNIVKLHEYFKD